MTKDSIIFPLFEEQVREEEEFKSSEEKWRAYKANYTALYSIAGEILIRFDEQLEKFEIPNLTFSIDGRVLPRSKTTSTHLTHSLILDRINKHKVLGNLPSLREEISFVEAETGEENTEPEGVIIKPEPEELKVKDSDKGLPVIVE